MEEIELESTLHRLETEQLAQAATVLLLKNEISYLEDELNVKSRGGGGGKAMLEMADA